MPKPNQNLSYPEFRAATWAPGKDPMGGTIGARSFEEWKAKSNVPAPGHEVTIAMSPSAAESAVADGRVKSLFELPKQQQEQSRRSLAYNTHRKGTEKALLGLPATAKASRRPIYGHVRETGDVQAEGNAYGRVHLDLWPGKNHITTTDGDSLDRMVDAYGGGDMPGRAPRAEAWQTTSFDDLKPEHEASQDAWGDYREAQIHGQIPMTGSHIKRAEVRDGGGSSNDKFLVQGLRARGIPTTVMKDWEQPSLITKDAITQHTGSGKPFVDYEDMPMTRGEHFWAGVPKEWENGGGIREPKNPDHSRGDFEIRAD